MICQMAGLIRVVGASASRIAVRSLSTSVSAELEAAGVVTIDEDEAIARENQLELSRNKSRLRDSHYRKYHGKIPYTEAYHRCHLTLDYNRRMFGQYGSQSGNSPAICWMTSEELDEKREYEALAHSQTIQEMVQIVKKRNEDQEKATRQREEMIENNLLKMDKWKQDLEARIKKKESEAAAVKAKKEKLLEEVRRHFGFKVDTKDERFKTLLEQKEKEQKKAEKMAKMKAKEAQFLMKIQQKSAEIS